VQAAPGQMAAAEGDEGSLAVAPIPIVGDGSARRDGGQEAKQTPTESCVCDNQPTALLVIV